MEELEPLTEEEKAEVFRIARNFQDNPKKVVKLLREEVGVERLQLAVAYLKSVVG